MTIYFILEAIMISTYVALSLVKHQSGSVPKIEEGKLKQPVLYHLFSATRLVMKLLAFHA
jgi:hypothetical protein